MSNHSGTDHALSATDSHPGTPEEGSALLESERPFWIRALLWVGQGFVTLTLLSTLWFKFTYAPETQAIFADIGGRPAATVVGLVELVIAVLMLTPRFASVGALLAVGNMAGALATHLFVIGIELDHPVTGNSDRGQLFFMGLGIFLISSAILWIRRGELPFVGPMLLPRRLRGRR